jgi:hypothetical protein
VLKERSLIMSAVIYTAMTPDSQPEAGMTLVSGATQLNRGSGGMPEDTPSEQTAQTVLQPPHFKVRGPRGAPKKAEAEKTRTRWAEMGKPAKLTARVCDELAMHTYPGEYAKAERRSPARKRLRDRVAQQVRALMKKPGAPAAAI